MFFGFGFDLALKTSDAYMFLLVGIFENAQKKVIDRQKRHVLMFYNFIFLYFVWPFSTSGKATTVKFDDNMTIKRCFRYCM